MPNAKIGFSKAMSAGWLRIDKNAEGGPRVFRKVSSIDCCFSSSDTLSLPLLVTVGHSMLENANQAYLCLPVKLSGCIVCCCQ